MLVNRDDISEKLSRIFPFTFLNSDKVNDLAEKSEVVFFEAGNLIYMEGANAASYFVIYEGDIEILVEKNQALRRINILGEGDCFGEDFLEKEGIRLTSVRALSNSLLIKIPKKVVLSFIAEYPEIDDAFAAISSSYLHLISFPSEKLSGETVFYFGNPHYFSFLKKALAISIAALILILLTIMLVKGGLFSGIFFAGVNGVLGLILVVILLWFFLDWKNDIYMITGKRVINLNRKLVVSDSKFEIPLSSINNLEIKKGLIGQSMRFGDLVIRTYTGETLLKNVPLAATVQSYLEFLIARDKVKRRSSEREIFKKIVSGHISAEAKIAFQGDLLEESDSVSVENNGDYPVVIFHTHWIILVKKLLIPSLLLLSLILLILFSYANGFGFINSGTGFIAAGISLIGNFLWWLYRFSDWKNDQYHISQEKIIDICRRPFGLEDRRTASIHNIQSIRYERIGFFGLLLNFGTVYIRVGDEEFTFNDVPNPAKIQEKLFNVLERSIQRVKKTELTEQQHRLAEWLDTYNQIREKKEKGINLNN